MKCIVDRPATALQPSPQLLAFVKRQVRNAQIYVYAGPERRIEPRHLTVLPAVVQPVDEQMRPLGPPVAMVTHELSTHGVGLVHEQRLQYDRIAVRMMVQEEEVLLVGEIRWRKPVGPFYMSGCEVIAKLDRFPVSGSRIDSASAMLGPTAPSSTAWHCPA